MAGDVETIRNWLIALFVLVAFLVFLVFVFGVIVEIQLKEIRKLLEKNKDS